MLFLPEQRRRISFEAFAHPADRSHFSALFLSQLLCITLYNILFIEHFAAEMLPLAFFYFKLSKFIVCYGIYSNVFLSVFSPIPSPPWTHLRRLEKCLNTHNAACSSCLFTGLGETRYVSFFKKANLTEQTTLKYSSFCIIQPFVLVW